MNGYLIADIVGNTVALCCAGAWLWSRRKIYCTVVHKCPFCKEGLVYCTIPGKTYLNRACAFCDMHGYFLVRELWTGQSDGKDYFVMRKENPTILPPLRGTKRV